MPKATTYKQIRKNDRKFSFDTYIPHISLTKLTAKMINDMIYSTEPDKTNIIFALFNATNKELHNELNNIDTQTCRYVLTIFLNKFKQNAQLLKTYNLTNEYMILSQLNLIICGIQKALENAILSISLPITAYTNKIVTEFTKIYGQLQYDHLGEDFSENLYIVWEVKMRKIYNDFFPAFPDTNSMDTEDTIGFLYTIIMRATCENIQKEARYISSWIKCEQKSHNDNVYKSVALYNIYTSLQNIMIINV